MHQIKPGARRLVELGARMAIYELVARADVEQAVLPHVRHPEHRFNIFRQLPEALLAVAQFLGDALAVGGVFDRQQDQVVAVRSQAVGVEKKRSFPDGLEGVLELKILELTNTRLNVLQKKSELGDVPLTLGQAPD